ncbi:MAG: DUF515 domain-containing protein [Thermococcus sp.]|nr:DUF515 domain-containing protein [Thermococcus sp.]
MSEDIEAKIRRLRELGKTGTEPKAAPPARPPRKRPSTKPKSVSSIRGRERRKRILVGASIVIIIILIISIGAYVYMQNQAAERLNRAKQDKLAQVNTYFKGDIVNQSQTCSAEPIRIKNDLVRRIQAADSMEELERIDVKAAFSNALQKYNACIEEQRRIEFERKLNQTKQEKVREIELAFQPLLSKPLPDDIKKKVVATLNSIEQQVMEAESEAEVNSTSPEPYLLSLWRDYYYYLIDTIPGQEVVLEKGDYRSIVTKAQAKSIIGGVLDYREIMQYKFYQVQYVDIALVLTRDRINGAFLAPGDRVVIFAKNSTNAPFREIVNQGYVEMILLPVDAGRISVSESQSQSSTSSSSSSTNYAENHQESYNAGGGQIGTQEGSSDTYQNTQTNTQTASASYSYAVDLKEILKALAAGKLQSPEAVRQQLEAYGWRVVDLEKESGMLVLQPNAQFMVIIRVPSIFVPDILTYQDSLYLAKIST